MTVRVLTDSTCDLPAEVITRLGVYVLPLYIHVGSQSYLDGIDMTREEFYKNLPTFPEHPTTAVPSPEKFHALYNAFAEGGANEILSIHISTSLSAIVNIARTAAEQTTSAAVTVLDSRQLSLGTGFLVETAAKLAQAGHTVTEILAILENQIKRTHVFATLDTLTFLQRSGRMSSAMSTIGELFKIKPLLKMYDGISNVERLRTRKHAIKRLVELIREIGPFEKAAILHSAAEERATSLREEVKGLLPEGEIWLEQINPVLGAHLGPGVLGFAGISRAERAG